MAKSEILTPGSELAERLAGALRDTAAAPRPGARELPVLRGVGKCGEFTANLENVLVEVGDILEASGRVYSYGNQIVMETDWQDGTGAQLVLLRTGGKVETGAEDWLANLMVCEERTEDQIIQFAPTRSLIDILFRSEPMLGRLPRIRQYSHTPVFDDEFVLRGPGWHPDQGLLVHGPEIEPAVISPADPNHPVLERLPRHLRTLLGGFCFAGAADVANTIGMLLTGFLVQHFIVATKPMGLLDGNQPGVGKTLLARVIGLLLGGTDPRVIHYTLDDEELGKRICANVREEHSRVLCIDNAKVKSGGAVDSPVLEANSMAPEISLRILGLSQNYTRPNDLLWFLTMNDTKTSPDLVSRSLPIRLAYEGDPKDRQFDGPDPIAYVREHRVGLLGELAGMVNLWTQHGRPDGTRGHRCSHWGKVIGGIMLTAGFPEFLANVGEAAVAFNSALDELAALAEAAAGSNGPHANITATGAGDESNARGVPPKDWASVFTKAGVLVEELSTGKGKHAKSTRIGQFLTRFIGREVQIEVRGRSGRATLRVVTRRAKEKRYFFEVEWDVTAVESPVSDVSRSASAKPADTTQRSRRQKQNRKRSSPRTATPQPATTTGDRSSGGNAEVW